MNILLFIHFVKLHHLFNCAPKGYIVNHQIACVCSFYFYFIIFLWVRKNRCPLIDLTHFFLDTQALCKYYFNLFFYFWGFF
jgi:hypothetical protein